MTRIPIAFFIGLVKNNNRWPNGIGKGVIVPAGSPES